MPKQIVLLLKNSVKISFFALLFLYYSCSSTGMLGGGDDSATKRNADWVTSAPEAESIDEKLLKKAYNEAKKSKFIYSILVAKNGKLVGEKYFLKNNKRSVFEVRSVTKSIVSLLVGIAIEQGFIKDVDQKIDEIFPERSAELSGKDKSIITINHLLNMSSGFADNASMDFTPDLVGAVLSSSLVFTPGTSFRYSNGGTHILSAIIAKKTGMPVRDFANKYLFELMETKIETWFEDNQGISIGGTGLLMTARQMAKIGQLIQDNGMYKGKRIISASWIEESKVKRVKVRRNHYSYLWWLTTQTDHEVIGAHGYAGQLILSFRDLNMVIVVTTDPTRDNTRANEQFGSVFTIINRYIIPAIK